MFYTYMHCRADDGKPFYIGKGKGRRAWSVFSRNSHWRSVVAKHGRTVVLLSRWEKEQDALDHERMLIASFRSMGISLANFSSGGAGNSGVKHSEETKRRMADRARGRPCTAETRRKISEAKRGVPLSPAGRAACASRPKPPGPSKETQEKIRISSTRLFEEDGVRATRKEWAKKLGVDPSTVYLRIRQGRLPSGAYRQ